GVSVAARTMIGMRNKDSIMHRFPAIFSLLALVAVAFPVLAQDEGDKAHDAEWVQQKVQVCASCHGENGVSENPTFPILAGQYESYLYHALKGYSDGDRQNPVMSAQVNG